MHSVLLQIDDLMAKRLEKVAPAKSRLRTRFIRLAIQKALMELEDADTREAYARSPDEPPSFDPKEWGEWLPAKTGQRKRR
jgi:hypothetical protein